MAAAKQRTLAKVQESSSLLWCLLKLKSALSGLKTLGSQSSDSPGCSSQSNSASQGWSQDRNGWNSHSPNTERINGLGTCRNKLNQPFNQHNVAVFL